MEELELSRSQLENDLITLRSTLAKSQSEKKDLHEELKYTLEKKREIEVIRRA